MILRKRIARLLAAIAFLVPGVLARATTTVTDVIAAQRTDGTRLVDVYYNLSDTASPVMVTVAFSLDGGETYTFRPSPSTLSGDVGPGVTNGAKHIVWNPVPELPETVLGQMRAKVTVYDALGREYIHTLPGGVDMKVIRIPRGNFLMGSNPDADTWSLEREYPQHSVTFAKSYYMGETEVTQAQWLAVMGSWPGPAPTAENGLGATFPAYYLSRIDAQAFCDKLQELGYGNVRLPSEAEWEYACRAGTTTRYFFGDSDCPENDLCDGTPCQLDTYAWICSATAMPVAGKVANPFGLFDVHGNEWEWVQDPFHPSYAGAPTDGSPWLTGSPDPNQGILRGGSWIGVGTVRFRSAARGVDAIGQRLPDYGFRIVWEP